MKKKELMEKRDLSDLEIKLLREELDIDDEMDEKEVKEVDDDPYFLLAQRLANAPQVKVSVSVLSKLANSSWICLGQC